MQKVSDGRLALGLLAAGAIWLFAVLPFLYGPPPRFAETGSPPQAHADQAGQQPAAKPDGSISAPFFIRIPKTANEEAEEASDRREKSSTDRWLMIFTGAVAVFTFLLVGATVLLYFAGEKQLRLASETGKRQSDEMQKSIAVASRAATVAENTLIAADRAWISIDAKIIGSLTFDEEVVSLNVEFKMTNVGKSPATHVELFAMLCPDIIAARNTGEATIEMLHTKIFDFGVVLFPEGVNSRKLIIGMPIAQFRENIADAAKVVTEHGSAADVPRKTANPAIMACASYRLPGSKRRHHTVILFQVWHTDDRHLGWDGSADEADIILLRLVQTFMSGQVT